MKYTLFRDVILMEDIEERADFGIFEDYPFFSVKEVNDWHCGEVVEVIVKYAWQVVAYSPGEWHFPFCAVPYIFFPFGIDCDDGEWAMAYGRFDYIIGSYIS